MEGRREEAQPATPERGRPVRNHRHDAVEIALLRAAPRGAHSEAAGTGVFRGLRGGQNFVEGRKQLNLLLETRYDKSFAFTIAYNAFLGGGQDNLYRDRDNLGFFVKYQF